MQSIPSRTLDLNNFLLSFYFDHWRLYRFISHLLFLLKMKLTTLAYAISLLSAISASPIQNVHEHAKRDVVTNFVHVTQYVYENEYVFVDANGNPVSTSYELVSTGAPASPSTSTSTATSTVFVTQQPPASTTPSAASTTLATQTPAPAVTEDPYTPSTTSSPATTSTHPPPPPPSSPATTSTPPPTPATSSAAASSPSTGSGSSGEEFSGQATYFTPGLGACGITSTASDFICALNHVQFHDNGNGNDNPNCGKRILIKRGSRSVTVTVTDMCPGCNYGDLDLSPAAFDQIANEAEGRVDITWSFI